MKKYIRPIALLLSLILIFFTLTGCDKIKDMRKHQLYFTENRSVILNGTEYVQMDYISKDENIGFDFKCNHEEPYYLTEKDVPVLLAGAEGVGAALSLDKNFLVTHYGTFYCAKEKLNYYLNILSQPFVTEGYLMNYMDLDYNSKCHNFNNTEQHLIEQMLVSEDIAWSDKNDEESEYIEELLAYGKEKLLTKRVGQFVKNKGIFYFWVYTSNETDEMIVKKVPLGLYEFLNECQIN